jgi:hypothetical protein
MASFVSPARQDEVGRS